MNTKTCGSCRQDKPLDAFFRRSSGRDGRQNYCKECSYARNEAWRAANPEPMRARVSAWADANRDAVIARASAWNKANPTRRRAISNKAAGKRRARIACATVVEDIDRMAVWERDGGLCHICGLPADPTDWHLEHRVPVARGGDHSYANVAVSHPACNRRKGTRVTGAIRPAFADADAAVPGLRIVQ